MGHTGQLERTGQPGQTGQQMEMGMRLQDVQTPQQWEAVQQINYALQVCGFCADQCIQEADSSMIECIRLCEDVTELGEVALALLPRQSRFAGSILETFAQAADACAQECGQHHHAHCQECAEVLPQAAQAARQCSGMANQ